VDRANSGITAFASEAASAEQLVAAWTEWTWQRAKGLQELDVVPESERRQPHSTVPGPLAADQPDGR
jgi:hypothetical protein